MKVSMKNSAGLTRQVPVGTSLLPLILGPLPFFFRGQFSKGVLWGIYMICSLGLSNLLLMFSLNKITAHHYLQNGFTPTGEGWKKAGPLWGVDIQNLN